MEKYNFKQLLDNHTIEIPIIQRDYAQGRETPKIKRIRTEFLKSIKKVFTEGAGLHLDFVYGFNNGKFIPLDGQQRLTTLFLLHWYFRLKDQGNIPLEKFHYRTHEKVAEFIKFLLKQTILLPEGGSGLAEKIKNVSGFNKSGWMTEPTIKGMLVMLDAIHAEFHTIESGSALDKITFSFFDMGKNKLTDDLYIKMNSRGKPLTDFDAFKAQFESILADKPVLSKDFEEKIDKDWMDLFWQYRAKDEYTIDNQFMRVFWVFTEILYFKFIGIKEDKSPFTGTWNKNLPLINYKLINDVYQHEDAVKELFQWFDLCKKLGKEEISRRFALLFCEGGENEKHGCRLSIYGEKIDLFTYACFNGEMAQQRLLLFYAMLYSGFECSIDRMRIIRNLTLADTMRASNFKDEIAFIEQIIDTGLVPQKASGFSTALVKEENYKQEILKKHPQLTESLWKLENNPYLKGMVHLFNPYLEGGDAEKLQNIEKAFSFYFKDEKNVPDLLRRALLAKGDYSLYDGGGSWHMGYWEERYHLCNTLLEWQKLFTSFEENILNKHSHIKALLEEFCGLHGKEACDKKCQQLINGFSDTADIYYKMIKNPEVLEYSQHKRFMWSDDEECITHILVHSSYRNDNYKPYADF